MITNQLTRRSVFQKHSVSLLKLHQFRGFLQAIGIQSIKEEDILK